MSVVVNEQTKLTATALNNVAVAFVIAGFVGPMVAIGFGSMPLPNSAFAVVLSLVWLLVGVILHLMGRLVLLRMVP